MWQIIRKTDKNHFLTHGDDILCHYGILGMKWGVRRYQNRDGTLTKAGKRRYSQDGNKNDKQLFDEIDSHEQPESTKEYYSLTNIQRTNTPMAKAISKTDEYKNFSQLRQQILQYPKGVQGVSKELENSYWNALGKLMSTANQISKKYYGNGGIDAEELGNLILDMNDLASDYKK